MSPDSLNITQSGQQAPWSIHSHFEDAPAAVQRNDYRTTMRADVWQHGIMATERPVSLGENSMLATFIIVVIAAVTFSIGSFKRLIHTLPGDLWGIRQRENAFDNRTVGEMRTYLLIILLLCLSEGILMLTAAISSGAAIAPSHMFATTLYLSGLAAAYYMFQIVAYASVGYAFTDKRMASQWLRGFNASQALMSMLLVIPALLTLIYQASASAVIPIAIAIYIGTRLVFIFKGFRIFFDNILSLLYFILYLCALEITPLCVVASLAQDILSNRL